MTRQNQIPLEDGSGLTLALIPLWDMCNHTNGLVSFQQEVKGHLVSISPDLLLCRSRLATTWRTTAVSVWLCKTTRRTSR